MASAISRRHFITGSVALAAVCSNDLCARQISIFNRPKALVEGARYAFCAGENTQQVAVVDTTAREFELVLNLPHKVGALAVSEQYDIMLVADTAQQAVSVIRLSDHQLVLRNALNMQADVMLVDPEDKVVAYAGQDGVMSVWMLRTNTETVRVSGLGPIDNLTFGRSGRFLYSAQSEPRRLAVVDLAKGWHGKHLALPGEGPLPGLSRSLDGSLGFLSLPDQDALFIVDLTNNTLVTKLAMAPGPGRVYGSLYSGHFLVPHLEGEAVTILSSETFTPIRTIDVGYPVAEVLTGFLGTLAFAMPAKGTEIAVISLDSLRVIKRIVVPAALGPGVVTSDTKTIVAALPSRGEVALIDTVNQRLAATLATQVAGLQMPKMAVTSNVCH